MKQQYPGIVRYISLNILLFIILLLVLYGFSINKVYEWGSDDMVHYFMSIEAENIIAEPAMVNAYGAYQEDAMFQFYPHVARLPSAYGSYFPGPHQAGEILVYEAIDKVIYLLPFKGWEPGQLFYISHQFYLEDDTAVVGLSPLQMSLLLGLLTILVGYGLILKIAWSFIRPVKRLAQWSHSLVNTNQSKVEPGDKHIDLQNNHPIPDLKFAELAQVAQIMDGNVKALQNQNEKEKQFLRSLSHELRTPLAIIKASLELIAKTHQEIEPKIATKLNKIERANENMCSTSETLLWLWSGNMNALQREGIDMQALIAEVVESQHHLLPKKDIVVNISADKSLLATDRRVIGILLRNLVRNSFQYSQEGEIMIDYKNNRLAISNPASGPTTEQQTIGHSEPERHQEYGYGVGLYLVENICRQMDWSCHIDNNRQQFTVVVGFAP